MSLPNFTAQAALARIIELGSILTLRTFCYVSNGRFGGFQVSKHCDCIYVIRLSAFDTFPQFTKHVKSQARRSEKHREQEAFPQLWSVGYGLGRLSIRQLDISCCPQVVNNRPPVHSANIHLRWSKFIAFCCFAAQIFNHDHYTFTV
ncbi:hypothetical protein WG66_011915 [Moniliophthora roreri]|nr:hypothetical protein WG66_011915 [Moniliophthora roreri]